MKLKEFIKFLELQDQDAIVEVLVHYNGHGYYDQGGTCTTEYFDPDKHFEYTDFRDNKFAKGKPYQNDRIILLGSKDN